VADLVAELGMAESDLVPISMAPQPTDCPVSDSRPQVPVTGSELAYTAMYSWVPFYCSDPTKFNLEYVRTSDRRPGTR